MIKLADPSCSQLTPATRSGIRKCKWILRKPFKRGLTYVDRREANGEKEEGRASVVGALGEESEGNPRSEELVPTGSETTVDGTKRGEATRGNRARRCGKVSRGLTVRPLITVFNTISAIVSAAPRAHRRGYINITYRRKDGVKGERGRKMSISRWIIQGSRSFPAIPGRYSLRIRRFLCRLCETVHVCLYACTCIPCECWRWNNSWRKRDGQSRVTERERMSRWRRRLRPRRFRHRENREAVSTGEGLFLPVMDYRGISQYS